MQKIKFGHKDSKLKISSYNMTCYILEDSKRVISIDSIQKALGYDGKSVNWAVELLDKINTFIPIDSGLYTALSNPHQIEIGTKRDQKKSFDYGIEYWYFEDLCKMIIRAKEEGYLSVTQLKHAKAALQLLDVLRNTNLKESIDSATGFIRFKTIILEHLVTIFKKKDNDSAYDWIKTIPLAFIEEILKINQLVWEDIFKNPLSLWELLQELIFSRIDNEIWEDIRKTKPKRIYTRKNNTKQDIEHPKLKEYVLILNSLIKASGNNWNIFIQLLNKTFPKQKNVSKIVFVEDFEEKVFSVTNFSSKLRFQ
jgi:hypothetical protein